MVCSESNESADTLLLFFVFFYSFLYKCNIKKKEKITLFIQLHVVSSIPKAKENNNKN